MNHETFENQMIDTVNRHAEEKGESFKAGTPKSTVVTKLDTGVLKVGLKRMMIALLTAVLFAFSVCGFIATAMAPGYLAVLLFIVSLLVMGCAFVFLYAQGIILAVSRGEKNE